MSGVVREVLLGILHGHGNDRPSGSRRDRSRSPRNAGELVGNLELLRHPIPDGLSTDVRLGQAVRLPTLGSSIGVATWVDTEARPGLYQCFQRCLPFSIHRDNPHPPARHQAAVEHLAQGAMVDPAIGQGAVLHSLGRGAWGKPADGLAHWTCPAPDAGARAPARRHGRDRRILSRRTAKETSRRVDAGPWSQGFATNHKASVLAVVQRPSATVQGAPAGDARAAVVADLSMDEVERVLDKEVDPRAHLMSDEWKAFVAVGQNFAAHETVQHGRREYVRGRVHANSVEGFNLRVQRTVAGVFHHISPEHADLYFHEIGFRWSQRIAEGEVVRRNRHGREKTRTLWSRVPPALQLPKVFRAAVGREMRRTRIGGIAIKSAVAVFG